MTIEIYNLGLGDCNDIGNDMLLYGDEAFKYWENILKYLDEMLLQDTMIYWKRFSAAAL